MKWLLVIFILAAFLGLLLPALNTSRSQAKEVVCKNNIRQLILACNTYANDNSGHFVPAAMDILVENKHRWYGTRNNINTPFDTAKGPLASYLAGAVLKCPQQPAFAKRKSSNLDFLDYEEGCGGYGYNMIYLGSKIWTEGYEDKSCKSTAAISEVRKPAQTLIFADTAMAKLDHGSLSCTEYSFAEPRFYIINGVPDTNSWNPAPSIHFRHQRQAVIGWVDGHITSEKAGRYDGTNSDGATPAKFNIGWFEPMDNSLFDLE